MATHSTAQQTQTVSGGDDCSPEVIHFTVDGEKLETTEQKLTPKKILAAAGVDPKTHYLVQVFGKQEQESYKGRSGESIPMQENQRFLTVSTGPTTVS